MTIKNANDYLPIIAAAARGETIQFDRSTTNLPNWEDLDKHADWQLGNPPSRYRVKPNPREFWLFCPPDGRRTVLKSEKEVEDWSNASGRRYELIHVREVLP